GARCEPAPGDGASDRRSEASMSIYTDKGVCHKAPRRVRQKESWDGTRWTYERTGKTSNTGPATGRARGAARLPLARVQGPLRPRPGRRLAAGHRRADRLQREPHAKLQGQVRPVAADHQPRRRG